MQYEEIIKGLEISEPFLLRYTDTIQSRLASAGEAILQSKRQGLSADLSFTARTDIQTINDCINLAKTILMLGSPPEKINETLRRIHKESVYANQDPSTVINSSVLYHLLVRADERGGIEDNDQKKLKAVRHRFDQLNWMLDYATVGSLGFQRLDWSQTEAKPDYYSERIAETVHYGNT